MFAPPDLLLPLPSCEVHAAPALGGSWTAVQVQGVCSSPGAERSAPYTLTLTPPHPAGATITSYPLWTEPVAEEESAHFAMALMGKHDGPGAAAAVGADSWEQDGPMDLSVEDWASAPPTPAAPLSSSRGPARAHRPATAQDMLDTPGSVSARMAASMQSMHTLGPATGRTGPQASNSMVSSSSSVWGVTPPPACSSMAFESSAFPVTSGGGRSGNVGAAARPEPRRNSLQHRTPSRSLTFLKRKISVVADGARASPRDGQAHMAGGSDGAMATSLEACSHAAPISLSLQAGDEGPGERRNAPPPLIKRCQSAMMMPTLIIPGTSAITSPGTSAITSPSATTITSPGATTTTSAGCRTSMYRLPSDLPNTPPCSAALCAAKDGAMAALTLEHAMAALHSVASLREEEEEEASRALHMEELLAQAGNTVGRASHTEDSDGGHLPSVETLEVMLLKTGSRAGSRRSPMASGSAAPMHTCSPMRACSLQHHAPRAEQAAGTGCGGAAAAAAAPPALTHGSPSWQYHELRCSSFVDPASGARMLVVVQSDVTARVLAERQLAHMLEAEHNLLESIFPVHVLEHAIMLSGAPGGGACPADGIRMGTCPIGDVLPALADASSLATAHEEVTLLFADIVGASEHTFWSPSCNAYAASDSHTWPRCMHVCMYGWGSFLPFPPPAPAPAPARPNKACAVRSWLVGSFGGLWTARVSSHHSSCTGHIVYRT